MCNEGEIGVVPIGQESLHRAVQCRVADFAFEAQLPVRSTIHPSNGFAAVTSSRMNLENATYYAGTAYMGTQVVDAPITVQLGQFVANTAGLSSNVNPATVVTGLLRTTEVHHDQAVCFPAATGCVGPSVGATFQLKDGITFSSNFAPTPITVFVTPPRGAAGVKSVSKTFICRDPICHVNVPLPQEEFLAKLPSGPQNFTLLYTLDNSGISHTFQETITWFPAAESISSDVVDTVYTVAPSRDLYPGDQFSLEVRSRFKSYLKTALVRVSLGAGLRIIDDSAPTDAFKQSAVDRNDVQATVVLAGRKDGKPPGAQVTITNELLLTLTIRVDSNVETGGSTTIEISRIADLTDLDENGLNPTEVGVIETRDGVVASKAGTVYFNVDKAVGILARAVDAMPTELINTATVSSADILVPIKASAISVRGAETIEEEDSMTCTSPETKTLLAGGKNGCTATLTGTETIGARQIDFVVKTAVGETIVPFRVHQLIEGSTKIQLATSRLRPYAGYYNEADTTCQTLQYQSSEVIATASFADNSGYKFTNFDVTSLGNLASQDVSVVNVGTTASTAMTVTGVGEGTTHLRLLGKVAVLATAPVHVTSQSPNNMLGVVGLDIALVKSMGPIAVEGSGSYTRQTTVGFTMGAPPTAALSYEKDSMTVFVSAVFEDHSRLELNQELGLVLESHNSLALIVEGNEVVVPFDPVQASGPLLGVSWRPIGGCQNASYAMSPYTKRNYTLEVTPPAAKEMLATTKTDFIVCSDDGATYPGADFAASTQIAVSLKFDAKTVSNLERDVRVNYLASDLKLFTVDLTGKVIANRNGVIGSGTVNVTFSGQSAFKIVTIVVTKLLSLTMRAVPFPAYTGSIWISATTLSKIACTELYQQSQLIFLLELTNSFTKTVSGSHVDIKLSGSNMVVSDGSSRIITATSPGSQFFTATFKNVGENAKEYTSNITLTVSDSAVTVKSIDNLKMVVGRSTITTLSGLVNLKKAHIQTGITLSDDRQYISAFNSNGVPALPGLVTFESQTTKSISVDSVTGIATLRNNHYSGVELSATTCAGSVNAKTKSFPIYANLEPAAADADVGSRNGIPVPPQMRGSQFSLPIRVNTGTKRLMAFNVLVAYSEEDLELVAVSNAIPDKLGSVEFKPGSSVGNVDLETVCNRANLGNSCAVAVATISNSNVKGIVDLFTVTFKVRHGAAQVIDISGVVGQLLDTTSGGGETIGSKNSVFQAGRVSVEITDGKRHRSARLLSPAVQPRNRRSISSLRLSKGDTNCDDDFDLKDAVFILQYVAARGNDFQTALGKIMSGKVGSCQAKNGLSVTDLSFMDPDSNSEVTLLDLTYVLDILAGNFYFMQITSPDPAGCVATFNIEMSTAQGGPVPVGTRVFVDFAMSNNNELVTALRANVGFVTSNKGELMGALVEAVPIAAHSTMFAIELGKSLPMTEVGVSVIQLSTSLDASPSWKFFSGKPTSGFNTSTYKMPLMYSKNLLGSATDLHLKNGYNPIDILNRTVQGICTTTTTSTGTVTNTTPTTTTTTTTTTTSGTTTSTTATSSTVTSSTTSSISTTTTSVSTTTTSMSSTTTTTITSTSSTATDTMTSTTITRTTTTSITTTSVTSTTITTTTVTTTTTITTSTATTTTYSIPKNFKGGIVCETADDVVGHLNARVSSCVVQAFVLNQLIVEGCLQNAPEITCKDGRDLYVGSGCSQTATVLNLAIALMKNPTQTEVPSEYISCKDSGYLSDSTSMCDVTALSLNQVMNEFATAGAACVRMDPTSRSSTVAAASTIDPDILLAPTLLIFDALDFNAFTEEILLAGIEEGINVYGPKPLPDYSLTITFQPGEFEADKRSVVASVQFRYADTGAFDTTNKYRDQVIEVAMNYYNEVTQFTASQFAESKEASMSTSSMIVLIVGALIALGGLIVIIIRTKRKSAPLRRKDSRIDMAPVPELDFPPFLSARDSQIAWSPNTLPNEASSPIAETPFPLIDPDELQHHGAARRQTSWDISVLNETNYDMPESLRHQQPLPSPRSNSAGLDGRRVDDLFSGKRVSQKFQRSGMVDNLAMMNDDDLELPERDYMGTTNIYDTAGQSGAMYDTAAQSGAIYDTASPVNFDPRTGFANFGYTAFTEASTDAGREVPLHMPGDSTTDNVKVFRNSSTFDSDSDRQASGLLAEHDALIAAITDFEDGADAAYYLKTLDETHNTNVVGSLKRSNNSSSVLVATKEKRASRRFSVNMVDNL
jgi:hypothetical protein